MTQSPATARSVTQRWPLVSGITFLVLGVLLGLLIALRGNRPLFIDVEWMEEIVEHRAPWWEVPARVMNFVGGGWFSLLLALAIAVLLLAVRHRWAALYFAVTSVVSLGVVQLLKRLLGRTRPEDMLMVTIDSGAFPSGHVANAATMAAALGILLWRAWLWVAGVAYVILMMLSRTYLGVHWLSDTAGGLLIGAAVAVIVWAPFAQRLLSERQSLVGRSVKS